MEALHNQAYLEMLFTIAYIKENVPAACRLVPTVLGSQPPLPSRHSSDLVIVIIIIIIIIILTEISINQL